MSISPTAPLRFSEWMSSHTAHDHKFGRTVYRYHPRSDEHSKKLCELVIDDLLGKCPVLAQHVAAKQVSAATNARVTLASGKSKTLDLAIGEMTASPDSGSGLGLIQRSTRSFSRIRIACEAEQCMTEHSKTKPRIFDELSSSHEIIHQGDQLAIAAGIAVVNMARTFVSPLRQTSAESELIVTSHSQPRAATAIIDHLGGLKMRDTPGQVGFDAFAIIVIDCDNLGTCVLREGPPAPAVGSLFHYDTFLRRISDAYVSRFSG